MLDTKTKPVVKEYTKIREHTQSLFQNDSDSCELLNAGELADSLMTESGRDPFSKFIVPLFDNKNDTRFSYSRNPRVRRILKGWKVTIRQ